MQNQRPCRGHGSCDHTAGQGLSHVYTHPDSKDASTVLTESEMPGKCLY